MWLINYHYVVESWGAPELGMARVAVRECGRIPYAAGLALQQSLVTRFKNSQMSGEKVRSGL